jgi:hypothetical protein
MFPAPEGKWEPFKIREVRKNGVGAAGGGAGGDVEMGGTDGGEKKDGDAEGGVAGEGGQKRDDEEPEYEEDFESDEGAVWPLVGMFFWFSLGWKDGRGRGDGEMGNDGFANRRQRVALLICPPSSHSYTMSMVFSVRVYTRQSS